jgi:hypothetical protein
VERYFSYHADDMQFVQALSGPKPAFSEPEVAERGEWGWVRRFMALCILSDVTL